MGQEIAKTDLARLRRLWEAANSTDGCSATEYEAYHRAAHNALPALLDELEAAREEVREESNRWVSVIRGIDPEALCDFYDEHGSQEYLKAWLDARDRRQKLIGAAEELERIAANWYQEMVAWTATDFEERAAKLRQEAEGK